MTKYPIYISDCPFFLAQKIVLKSFMTENLLVLNYIAFIFL